MKPLIRLFVLLACVVFGIVVGAGVLVAWDLIWEQYFGFGEQYFVVGVGLAIVAAGLSGKWLWRFLYAEGD